jgi:NADH-ubiquinone oxidoreductase chain 6
MKTLFINIIIPVLALISSIFCITSKNPVLSVTFLIITFVLTSCYIMLIDINFIGISYIIVYVGAIAVLFLFIIMMINIKLSDILDSGNQYTKTLPLGLLIISLILYYLFLLVPFIFDFFEKLIFEWDLYNNLSYNLSDFMVNANNLDFYINDISQIENIAFSLYVYEGIYLIVISLILLLAMISAIIISSYKKNS